MSAKVLTKSPAQHDRQVMKGLLLVCILSGAASLFALFVWIYTPTPITLFVSIFCAFGVINCGAGIYSILARQEGNSGTAIFWFVFLIIVGLGLLLTPVIDNAETQTVISALAGGMGLTSFAMLYAKRQEKRKA